MTKTEIYQQSVLARLKLLQKIVATRKEYAEESVIIGMLASQGSFAKYEVEGIVAMSLNSLKKHANDLLEGGYPYLDLLRKKPYSACKNTLSEKKIKPNRPPKRI